MNNLKFSFLQLLLLIYILTSYSLSLYSNSLLKLYHINSINHCSYSFKLRYRKPQQVDYESNIVSYDSNLYNHQNPDNKSSTPISYFNALLLLNGVAILWGTQHVVIKSALDIYPTSSLVNFWRFILSTLLFSPSLIKTLVLY